MNNEEKILELLAEMRTEQTEIRTELAEMKTELAEIRSEQAKMRTEQSESRAEQAEMRAEQTEMRDLLQKVAVTQEGVVLPQLKLLAEGHQNLLDTLAPKSRVEALEEDVNTMKTVIRLLTHDVAELKKAQ